MMRGLGIEVHTACRHRQHCSRCRGTSRCGSPTSTTRCGYALNDGTTIDAGLVVFAAGVRPRDELARAAGLDMAQRGGVLTDLSCVTSDPSIYAIGEVAADRRPLLRPGRRRVTPPPRSVADRLLGGEAEFPGADMSTKLKLLGVDVASFGDAERSYAELPGGRGQRPGQADVRQVGALR